MDFCTAHLGKLPFIMGNKLMMVQRAGNGGGNAGNGWVEWDESVFSDINLNNPLKGADASEVFAHEIIHEWWGGLGVYNDNDGLWSDEGVTVYTTYRLMKEKYGETYAKENYVDVWQAAVEKQDRSYYYRHPEVLGKLPEKYQADLKAQTTEINEYCRMPLMILKAEQLVGGETKMDEILQVIQKKYAQVPDKYSNPFTYQMFLDACGLKAEDLNLE
jgi:disulfide oxidoreductase YuzD